MLQTFFKYHLLILGLLLILYSEVAAQSYTFDLSHLGSKNFIEARNAALAGKDELAVSFLKKFYRNESKDLGIVIHYSDFDPIRDSTSFKLFYHELIPDSVITYREILRKLIEAGPNGLVQIGNKHVYFPPDLQLPLGNKGKYGPKRYLSPEIKLTAEDSLFDFSSSSLIFYNCRISILPSGDQEGLGVPIFGRIKLKYLAFNQCTGLVSIENLQLQTLQIFSSETAYLKDIVIDNNLNLSNNRGDIQLLNVSAQAGIKKYRSESPLEINHHGGLLEMDRCSFTGSVGDSLLDLEIYFKVDQLHITNTRIKADVEFNGRVNEDVKLLDNRIEGMVDLTLFRFPETDTRFPFQQFNQASFVMWEKEDGSRITAEDFAKDTEGKKEYFYYWMATFKRLYDVYRKRADLESANICYQKMKELEILYLSKKPTRTFQDGMRLWMNRTMGFYTDHATNPAKALFISFLIILGFSGLYMFFPSDWDKESKSRLINEFKRLREPGAGNVQTRSLWTNFLISVANAFTLSLNAFVTLGFGNIPTSGLARYFCIIEGALGWFLLTLFSVSLINEVLI